MGESLFVLSISHSFAGLFCNILVGRSLLVRLHLMQEVSLLFYLKTWCITFLDARSTIRYILIIGSCLMSQEYTSDDTLGMIKKLHQDLLLDCDIEYKKKTKYLILFLIPDDGKIVSLWVLPDKMIWGYKGRLPGKQKRTFEIIVRCQKICQSSDYQNCQV